VSATHVSAGAAPIVARTSSPAATRALAVALSEVLEPGDLLLLVGGLGSGKTTLTQGLATGLGVTDPVTSPTFTLVRAYPCRARAIRTLLHADLYRLDRLQDVVDLGIGEMVEDDSVAVVEWGDVASSLFGPEVLTIELAVDGQADPLEADPGGADEERTVTVVPGGSWTSRRPALADKLRPWTNGA
jgi:tRNA threonylcarbamoyladenosine biosynthesis protein TsaE